MKIINKNTWEASGTTPAVSAMTYGEIAINHHKDNPRLLIKDSSDKIIAFPSETQINKKVADIDSTIGDLNGKIGINKTGIETLASWVATPLTADEINSAFV